MGFGLQCWDENGNMVVDTSDYNCRYIGTYNVRMNGRDNVVTQGVAGINPNNAFAVVVAGSYSGAFVEAFCSVGNGSFSLFNMYGDHTDETFTVEVYLYA